VEACFDFHNALLGTIFPLKIWHHQEPSPLSITIDDRAGSLVW